MSLDDIVPTTITAATVFPTRLGFGIPLLMAYHTVTPNRVDIVASTAEVTALGFGVTSAVYLMVQRAFSNNPRPPRVVIGRRALPFTKTIRLIPVATAAGNVYSFTVTGTGGVDVPITYTIPSGGKTVAELCTILQALIVATGVTATDNTTYVGLAAAAGALFNVKALPVISIMKVLDMTADPGIATDLAAVAAVDNTTWFGCVLDSSSEAESNAAAAYFESTRKIFVATTSDSQCADAGVTTDVMSDFKAAAYKKSGVIFDQYQINSWAGLGWMAGMLPFKPGAGTWEFRTIPGVTVSVLTDAQQTAIKNKYGAYYVVVAGVNSTLNSKTGSGQFWDITVYLDKLHAGIQQRAFSLMKAMSDIGSKVPFTDKGAAMLVGEVKAELADGVKVGALRADPAPIVTAVKVADVSTTDRALRNFPDISFSAELAGAVHSAEHFGTLSI